MKIEEAYDLPVGMIIYHKLDIIYAVVPIEDPILLIYPLTAAPHFRPYIYSI